MKALFSILIGLPIFIFFVVQPLRAIFLMNVAFTNYGDNTVIIKMLSQAHMLNPYNNQLLYLLGDVATAERKYPVALWAYGTGMMNSRTDALLRAKYGAALHAMGFNGSFAMKEALTLEPNNPLYKHYLLQYSN